MTLPIHRTTVALLATRLTLGALALAASSMVSPAIAGEKQDWVGTWTASPQPTCLRCRDADRGSAVDTG